ncbi:MAG: DUF1987 domain-containing protein [Microscillaceae bacterium]|nr:DUF1987 domain-containing protein [Microscillaceae bacterium]
MDNLYLKGTESSPEINFKKGLLEICGNSFPEDAVRFWNPLINWVDSYAESDYVRNPQNHTDFICKVSYFNTGSRPFVLTLIKELNELAHRGHRVNFYWYYEDDLEEILDDGDLNFAELIDDFILDVQFIPVKKL